MAGAVAREEGADRWKKMGGNVLQSKSANGRVTRTFVAPSGDKFRSWKECMRYMDTVLLKAAGSLILDSNNKQSLDSGGGDLSERSFGNGKDRGDSPQPAKIQRASGESKPNGVDHTKHSQQSSSENERKRSREFSRDEGLAETKKGKTSDSDGDELEVDGQATPPMRIRPRRAAAGTNFKEKTYVIEDAYVQQKVEKMSMLEQEALVITAGGNEEDRRLLDFVVHDEDGAPQPLEVVGSVDLYVTGLVLPKNGIIDKERGVRCEAFGPLISWSIEGYDKGTPMLSLATGMSDYLCIKPAGTYKRFYTMLYEKAVVCVEVYRALNPSMKGDPNLGLNDLHARVSRALISGRHPSLGQFFTRDYFVTQGEFITNQLKELDGDASDDDQLFSGLPALEALEEECTKRISPSCLVPQRNGTLSIQEPKSGVANGGTEPEEEEPDTMDGDEKLARHLQEYEDRTTMNRQNRRSQPAGKGKVYIKINEDEIAADYPLPAYYKAEEQETDEFILFDDDNTLLAPEDLPRRMLHDWALYNSDSRLISLELLPMLAGTEMDVEIFGSGMMTEDDGSGFCLHDEAERAGVSAASHPAAGNGPSGHENGNIQEENRAQGIRLYLSAIKEWMIEFGASMVFISIRTDGAWYRLGTPSQQYVPWYTPVVKTARLAIKTIAMLKHEQRVSRLSFNDVVKRLAEQSNDEPTFINSKVAEVERYVVVHGQIILQQFAEYPDETIRRSAFVSGLVIKMEQKHHTKLVFSKKKVLIKKGQNLNPRADLQPDSRKRKPMRATTTHLVNRIWSEYYAKFSLTGEGLEKVNIKDENKELGPKTEEAEAEAEEEEEESEEEEEAPLSPKYSRRSTQQIRATNTKMRQELKWVGKPVGRTPAKEPVYERATYNGESIVAGGAVVVNVEEEREGSEQLPSLLLVEYLYQASDGSAMLHGRVLERGSQTVLGNAANPSEIFLTELCADVEMDAVRGSVVVEIKKQPWGYVHRKANAAIDLAEREHAKEREKKGLPIEYFCRALYAPDKGAFFSLPKNGFGVGDGSCTACLMREESKERFKTCMLPHNKGFKLEGVEYCEGDFLYLDPSTFEPLQDKDDPVQGEKIFKGGRNKGLRPFAVCELLSVQCPKKKNGIPAQLSVRRFYRPDDFGPHKGYIADIHEVYYSEEKATVEINAVRGRCEVLRPMPVLDTAVKATANHVFFCSCFCDPSNGTVKQLPANIKLGSHARLAEGNGTGRAAELAAKAKGKGKAVESEKPAEILNGDDSHDERLVTLDIFAGCGGLSEGLQQSGATVTKWAIEYEYPAAEAFKLNHPRAEVFCENCNVVLRCIMERGGDLDDCLATTEAVEMGLKLSNERKSQLPNPGEVDFINGGPPCQGFSGMNRFNTGAWSKVQCEMILAFLSYAEYFRPRYFLLENVRNFVSFNKGQTFRLTLATLLEMGYQVRFGVLQAGNYGVSQSRKRAFIWAAAPDERLPEWPEPMHVFASSQLKIGLPGGLSYAAVRDAGQGAPLRAITVKDTISDLPAVENGASKEELKYGDPPVSWFQKQIRGEETTLYDHIAKEMNELNLERCKRIPRHPGADWRSLPEEKVKLSTGQLVDLIPWCLPNTADRHNQWKGLYGRLDWQGNFPTSVTDPQPMGKVGMCFHPEQNRIVTVRECARSQGFPDKFKFSGNIQSKHRQIGNAVPPPLARALGLKLKEAFQAKKGQP